MAGPANSAPEGPRKVSEAVSGLLRAARRAGDALGDLKAEARETVRALRDWLSADWKGGRWLLRAPTAAGGVVGGVLGFLDQGPLADSAPLRVVVITVSLVPALDRLASKLDEIVGHEANREFDRRRLDAEPAEKINTRIAQHRDERDAIAGTLQRVRPELEKRTGTAELLEDLQGIVDATIHDRIALLLIRKVPSGRYRVVVTRGPVDDNFKKATEWSATSFLQDGPPLAKLAAAADFASFAEPFFVGSHHYLLGMLGHDPFVRATEMHVVATTHQLVSRMASENQAGGSITGSGG